MNSIINYKNTLHTNINNYSHLKDKIKNKNVKKIVNVYQQKFINANAAGFGDYLRGCISLSLICDALNIEFGMNIKNHPIQNFINTKNHLDADISYNNIKGVSICGKVCDETDIDNIILEINSTEGEICYLYTTLWIDENELNKYINKQFIVNVIKYLMPSGNLNVKMLDFLNKYNLNKINYRIIHIRGGDDMLVNNNYDEYFMNGFASYIVSKLKKTINNSNLYIIISDNIQLKNFVNRHFSNTSIINNTPVHLGIGNIDENNVMGTMFDFYIMANSSQIISFSRYNHGSGFSKWASFLFNKPYTQYIFTEVNNNFNNLIK